jgi:SAM-dependent methyltransferase
MFTEGMAADAHYILGHDDEERWRLRAQADFMEDLTRRFLLDAGLRAGMRVLDVGAGFGDVSLLAASIVGPGGEVLGVERESAAVRQATIRAAELGVANVSFVSADVRELPPARAFDAVVGRFVLMYVADAAEVLTALAHHTSPGGVIAFQEWHAADRWLAAPDVALWTRTGDSLVETFRRAGTDMHTGLGLRGAYLDAGLPAPQLRVERLAGGGPDFGGYAFLAGLVRSTVTMFEHYGVATAAELEVETLEERLREAVTSSGSTVALPSIVGAWSQRLPAR